MGDSQVQQAELLQSYLPAHVLEEPTLEERVFLKSDIRNFTRLTDFQNKQGDEAKDSWFKLIETLGEIFSVIKTYSGTEVGKEGDAVLGAFRNAEYALGAALAAQEKLAQLPKVFGPDPENPEVNKSQNLLMRIGLATGPCYLGYAESGNRRIPVFGGPVVDEAYHIEEAAPPGKVAVDDKTKDKLPYEFEPRDFHGHTVWVPKIQTIQAPELTTTSTQKEYETLLKFFPKKLLDKITKPEKPRYQPATIFFAELPMLHEIVQKAATAGSLQDVRAAYDSCFRVLQPAIEDNGGLALKYYKNKIIAGFGITDVSERSIASAREMHKKLKKDWLEPSLRRLAQKYNVNEPFLIGAIHQTQEGGILTGTLGGEHKFFDILGDDVNITARLAVGSQEEARIRGEPVCITYSRTAIKDRDVTFVTKKFATIHAKGKGDLDAYDIIEEEEKKAKQLIGRDDQIKDLDKAIREFYAGTPTVLNITGEAGSGKTELTKVLMERFKGEIYTANSVEYAKDVPDRLMQTLLRNYLNGSIEKVPEDKKAIVNHWLSLGLKEYAAPALSPEALAEKRLETLIELLSGSRKLVVLNDVHWADEESLAKWQKLTQRLGNVLFVTNYRDEIDERRKYLAGTEIKLGKFDKQGTKQLIERKTGTASEELVKFVYEKSEGVPLFIEEITEYLQEKDLIQDGKLKTTDVKIQDKNGIFLSRLDQLAEHSREAREYLINASAMYGDEWETDFFEANPETIKLLLERGFLKQNGKIGWKHNLMRTAIYNSLRADSDRKQLHTRIGRLMETKWAGSIDDHLVEVAFEFEKGDDTEKALEYNYLAERTFIIGRKQYTMGILYADKMKQIFDRITQPTTEHINFSGMAENGRGIAFRFLRQKEQAGKAYETALKLAEKLPESLRDGLCLKIHANLFSLYSSDLEKSAPHYFAGVELAKKLKDERSESVLKLNRGQVLNGEERIRLTQEAITLLSKYGDSSGLALAYNNLCQPFLEKGLANEAIESGKKGLAIAERVKDIVLQGRCKSGLGIAYDYIGDYERAKQYFAESEKQIEKTEEIELIILNYDIWAKMCIKANTPTEGLEVCERWEKKCQREEDKQKLEKTKKELLLLLGQNK